MGRPPKKGLLFYSKSIDFYNDFKIGNLMNEYGPLGATIYEAVLSLVFREHYYLEATPEQLTFSVMRLIGNKWIKNKKTVMQVIDYCADIGLFDKDLLRQNIITSVELQQTYAEVAKRRQFQNEKYWLLENDSSVINAPETQVNVTETRVNVTETPVNVYDNATKESKVNESKVNETKLTETISENSDVDVVVDFFKKNIGLVSSAIVDDITNYLAQGYEDKLIIECIRKAVFAGKSTWGYVKGILNKLAEQSIKTLEQFNCNGKKSKPISSTSYDLDELDKFWDKVPRFEKLE